MRTVAFPAPVLPEPPPRAPAALPPPLSPLPLVPVRDRRIALLAVLAALTMAMLGVVIGLVSAGSHTSIRSTAVPIVRPADQILTPALDVAGIVAKVQPSIVYISTRGGSDTSVGTGLVVTADGDVLTNAHVVNGAGTLRVRFAGETDARSAKVTASDATHDLALLHVAGVTGLTPAVFAQAGDLQVGDEVVAIGFALDLDGGPSVTRGIVSALDRSWPISGSVLDGLIQTDAPISSGNSGGPLVNNRGQVVGVNTAVARSGTDFDANNIGFALAVGQVLPILDRLHTGASVVPAFLGVKLAQRTDGGQGSLITGVVSGSPAAQAGIQVGDFVLSVDGHTVAGPNELIGAIADTKPGHVVAVGIERNGTTQILNATVTVHP